MSTMPAARGIRARQVPLFEAKAPVSPRAVDFHALSRPARTFTGDFYFTHRHGERFWFAVGDVAGKGLNAAVFMAMIQEELEQRITACASLECDPAATVHRLHEFLRGLMPSNKFATGVVGFLHDDGSLRIANAGHPPVLVARKNGTVEEIGSTGPVMGLLPGGKWISRRARLTSGDSVILYSDGLVEGQSASGEEFGVGRIAAAAKGADARAIAARITSAFDAHVAHKREDDLTLVVAKM
jgi:phosphoserine phosphatase RsbU/P